MNKLDLITPEIHDLATPELKEKIDAARKFGVREACRQNGFDRGNFYRSINGLLQRAKNKGIIPGLPSMIVGEGNTLGKVTTQINEHGVVKNIWYRQDSKLEDLTNALSEFCKDLPKFKPKKPKSLVAYNKDIIPFINIGDGHIGMLSYKYEVGQDFDVNIAERDLCCAMQTVINEIPTCERVVVQDMGDMTHYENISGTTEASGHNLDCDGRFYKMIESYVRIMRFIVESALDKFKYVDVIINQGNHSRTNDLWMNALLKNTYSDEPRLKVIDNQNVFIPYRMGNTFVMCHHSDKCRPNKLVHVMSTDYRHDFGEALYKYIDIGHIHHNMVVKEHPGVVIESFNQLATSDKYAHDGGWRSRSSLNVIYRSKTYGEVGRIKLPLERVRDIIEGVKAGTNSNKRTSVYTVK